MDIVLAWISNHWTGLAAIGGVAVMYYQHRLLWREYRKRHNMNGHSKED